MPGYTLLSQPGDLLVGGIAGIEARLPGNTTTTRKFLLSVGDGENPSTPSWDQVGLNDVSGLNDALAGKAAAIHSHSISDITSLQTALDAKASLSGATFTGNVTVTTESNPRLRLAAGGSTTSYSDVFDEGAILSLRKTVPSGPCHIRFDPRPLDGTSEAQFGFFRSTNTTGPVALLIHVGDNTATPNSRLAANRSSYLNAIVGDVGIGTNSPTAKLDVNGDTFRLRSSRTPASANAAGNAGDICWDANYIYVCIATNTWRRIAHESWT